LAVNFNKFVKNIKPPSVYTDIFGVDAMGVISFIGLKERIL